MTDIELVIKMPEKIYKHIMSMQFYIPRSRSGKSISILEDILKAIRNGTPLPKGHGRLGDLDILLNKAMKHRKSYMEAELGDSSYCRGKLHAYELYVEEVENVDAIIEAEKEG